MKDLPHHINKLNRRVIRSVARERAEEEGFDQTLPPIPNRKQTSRQVKKQAKATIRIARDARIPEKPTIEERNREMKHRVPIFDRTSHPRPKRNVSHKKAPRI